MTLEPPVYGMTLVSDAATRPAITAKMWFRLLLPGVPTETLPGFFFTWAMNASSVPSGVFAGTSSVRGSVVTRAIGVNCSLLSGVRPCAINDRVELALAIEADGVHLGRDDGDAGSARERLGAMGLTVMALGDEVQIAAVQFGSAAEKLGLEQGFRITQIEMPAQRPAKEWMYVPALLLLAVVIVAQRARLRREPPVAQTGAASA